ncbi:MAG: CBS domain-containing protein [Oscillospiraceae bacterium]|jgi:CBS domain-containing protein|nr:CBS domain-containing protein [Oscillospiraceae bacterium]
MNIGEIMTGNVISIREDESVSAAAKLLKRNNIGSLPVHDSRGKLKGIVTDRDIVLRCVAADEDASVIKVSEIMSRNLVTADSSDSTEKVSQKMASSRVRRLPVTEGGMLVGIVALADIARSADCKMEAAKALTEISGNFRKA